MTFSPVIPTSFHPGDPRLATLISSGVLGGWRDSLAGIPFALRLQTHRGDNIPLGLYQDAACTIPAVTDGDPVGGWRDEISGSGLVAVQSISTQRPTLRFRSGVPVLEFDGVDDFLSLTLARPFPFSISVSAKSSDTSFGGMAGYGNFNVAIGNGFPGTAPNNGFWIWTPNAATTYGEAGSIDTDWHNHIGVIPSEVESEWVMYRDGIAVGSPGLDAATPQSGATTLFIGQSSTSENWAGDMTSYMQSTGAWDSETSGVISSYNTSLHP